MFNGAHWYGEKIEIPEVDLSDYYTQEEVNTLLSYKQGTIDDLTTIRSGAALGATALQPSALNGYATSKDVEATYVKKVSGKGLSTEDFTTALKNKLNGLSNYDDTAISQAINTLRTDFDTLVGDGAQGAIDTFNEIIAFLEGVEENTLSGIIAGIEKQIGDNKTNISNVGEALRLLTVEVQGNTSNISKNTTAIATNKADIATNKTNIANNATAIENLSKYIDKLFTFDEANETIKTKYNFSSEKSIATKGIGTSSGGGSSYGRLDDWTKYDASKGDVLSALLGYGLKNDIATLTGKFGNYFTKSETRNEIVAYLGDFNNEMIVPIYSTKSEVSSLADVVGGIGSRVSTLEGKATAVSFAQTLTGGKQIGTITIDGKGTALFAPAGYAWGEITSRPTKLSDFTNDLGLGSLAYKSSLVASDIPDLSGKYLSLNGGIITGTLNVGNNISANGTGSFALGITAGSTSKLSLIHVGSIEMNVDGKFTTNGGYIDFHYGGSQDDYTSRIIENERGRISIYADTGVDITGEVRIGGKTAIHSGNIGSQSVASATSATYLTRLGVPSTDVFADYVAEYIVGKGVNVLRNSSGAAIGDIPNTSTVLNVGNETARFFRLISYKDGDLYYQTPNSSDNAWATRRTLLDSENYYNLISNVASADYATSAGDADTLDTYHEDSFFRYRGSANAANVNCNDVKGFGMYHIGDVDVSNTGYPTANGNMLNFRANTGLFQILSNSIGSRIWIRSRWYNNKTEWRQIAYTSSNVASATKATQDGNGNVIATTYLPLSGGKIIGDFHIGDDSASTTNQYYLRMWKEENSQRHRAMLYVDANGTSLSYYNKTSGLLTQLVLGGSSYKIGTAYTLYDIIHSGNIGSQSVNYATSAGSADNATKWDGFKYHNIVINNSNDRPYFKLVTIRVIGSYINSVVSFDVSGRGKGVAHIQVYTNGSSSIGSSRASKAEVTGDSLFADQIRVYTIGNETDSSGNITSKVIEVWYTQRQSYDAVVVQNVHWGQGESVEISCSTYESLPTSYESYIDATIGSIYGSITKLSTARTIWGQSFDGTGNVSGAMSGITTLNASGAVTLGSTLSVSSGITSAGAITIKDTLYGIGVTGVIRGSKLVSEGAIETGSLKVGGILIEDKDGDLFINGNLAASGSIATKGVGTSSSGGSGTIPWSEVPMSILPANNTLDLGSNAKPWDRVFSSYFGTNNNHTIITGTSVNIASDLYFSNGIDHIDADGNAYLHSIYMDDELVATEAWVNNKLGAAASYGIGYVQSGNNGLVTGNSVYVALTSYESDVLTAKYATLANTYTKTQVNNNFATKSEAMIDVSTTIVGSRAVKPTLTLTDGDSSWSMDVAKVSGSNVAITKYCVYSESESLMELSQSGDMWLNGRLTQSSDETLKNILSYNVDMKVRDIANAPICYFTWKDRVSDRQIGTIAQYWELITPECVIGEEGQMSMDYSTLGLVSSVINAREIVKHEDEIETLKKRVKELEDKLAALKAA